MFESDSYLLTGSPHPKNLEVPATKLGQFVGKLSGNIQQPQPVKRCGAVGVVELPSSQVKHSEI